MTYSCVYKHHHRSFIIYYLFFSQQWRLCSGVHNGVHERHYRKFFNFNFFKGPTVAFAFINATIGHFLFLFFFGWALVRPKAYSGIQAI